MKTPLQSLLARALCGILLAAALTFATQARAQYDISGFLPPGVTINSATPQQITEAVVAAVQANPDAAPQVATGTFQSVVDAGRYTLPGSQDGKQGVEPDGSSSDPTLDEWGQRISDAAKQANPALAPMIDSAMASAVSNAQTAVTTPGTGPSVPDGGGTTPPPPPPPGGGGGGGGGTQQPASN
jgi:hypothetical protein